MILELDCQVFCTTISARISTEKEIKTWKCENGHCSVAMDCNMGKLMRVLNSIKILFRFSTLSLVVKDILCNYLKHFIFITTSSIFFISEQICVSFCEKRKRNKQRAEVRRLWQEISSIKHFPKTIIKHTTSKS